MRFDINLWFKQSFLVLLFFSITQIWACGSENKSRGSERRVSSKAKNETTKDLPEITKAEDNDAEKNNEGLCTEKNPCGKCKSWKLIDGEDQHFDPKSHRIGQNCGNNLGVCSFGKWACLNEKEQSVIFCQGNIKAKKESCDNLDNDCDGKTDESFSRKNYYLDKDYDGYGDGNSWIKSCFQPKWHVENDTDCNDNNKLINPSVKENCLDKVDNNCNGKLDLEDSFCKSNSKPKSPSKPASTSKPPSTTKPNNSNVNLNSPLKKSKGYLVSQSKSKRIVKDKQNNLWIIYQMEDGQKGSKLLLSKSSDQGKTWSAAKFQVNDKNTGNSKGIRLGDFGIAIDSGNNIHISWDSLSLTYEISNWYRKYSFDTKKLILRPENTIDLNKIYNNGIRSKRTGSAAISIDKDDIVWLTMGGSKRWLSKLLKSEKKMASNMKFKSLGDLATNYSTQSISLELANNGNPIWTFYRNSPPGEVWLSYFDKVKNKINSGERLGNTQSPNDYLSQVCTDSLGGIHTLVYKDTAIKNKHSELVYRLYDPVLGFGQEITIFKDPNYNVLSNSQANSFAIGCMQKSGDVFVVYRDFSKNAELVLSQKKANQFKFNQIKTLAPKSKANNAYLNPSISGSLWPKFNRSETSLLISWQELKQGFYSLNFERVSFAKGANNVQPN